MQTIAIKPNKSLNQTRLSGAVLLNFHRAGWLALRWTTYTTERRFGAIDLPAKKWYQDTAAVVA